MIVYPTQHCLWAVCDDCQFGGDLFEIVATVSNSSPRRLRQKALSWRAGTGKYIPAEASVDARHRSRRRKFIRLVAESRDLLLSGDGLPLLQRAGIDRWAHDWLVRARQVIGYLPKLVYKPNGKQDFTVPVGAGWSGTLVIPLLAAPGLPASILFCGQHGSVNLEGSQVKLWRNRRSAGIAMLPCILPGRPNITSAPPVLLADPVLATRLQLRHLRDNEYPLPIGGILPADDCSGWEWANLQHIPVWSPNMPDAIRVARRLGGMVSTLKVPDSELAAGLRHYSSQQWLSRISKQSRPWRVALMELLDATQTVKQASVISEIGITPAELDDILNNCGPDLRSRLQLSAIPAMDRAVIRIGTSNFQLRHDGLWMNGRRVASHSLKISEMVYQNKLLVAYTVIASRLGESTTLNINIDDIKRSGLFEAVAVQLPDFEYCSKVKNAIHIVRQLSRPKKVNNASAAGWQPTQRAISVRNMTISAGGSILLEYRRCYPTLPMIPDTCSVANTDWSLQLAIASQLVGIISGIPNSIALTGERAVGYLPQISSDLGTGGGAMALNWIQRVSVDNARLPAPRFKLTDSNPVTAAALSVMENWQVVNDNREPGPDQDFGLLTGYLQHLAVSNFSMPEFSSWDSLLAWVRADFAGWIKNRFGIRIEIPPTTNPAVSVISAAVRYCGLSTGVVGFDRDKPVLVDRRSNTMSICISELIKRVEKYGGVLLSTECLLRKLPEARVDDDNLILPISMYEAQ